MAETLVERLRSFRGVGQYRMREAANVIEALTDLLERGCQPGMTVADRANWIVEVNTALSPPSNNRGSER